MRDVAEATGQCKPVQKADALSTRGENHGGKQRMDVLKSRIAYPEAL